MRQWGPHLAIAVRPAASLLTIACGDASARGSRLLRLGLGSDP